MHHIHETHITQASHVLNSFHTLKYFVANLNHLYTTQNSDLFVTFQEDLKTHTGQPNPQSIMNEYITGKIVLYSTTKHYVFPAIYVSNHFATIDYDVHFITKINYTINHVFCSMTVQELIKFHTICELERNQLLTKLAMSVQNPQLAGFLLTGNRSNFLYVEGSTAWLYDRPQFFHLYTKLIVALTESLYNKKILSCT